MEVKNPIVTALTGFRIGDRPTFGGSVSGNTTATRTKESALQKLTKVFQCPRCSSAMRDASLCIRCSDLRCQDYCVAKTVQACAGRLDLQQGIKQQACIKCRQPVLHCRWMPDIVAKLESLKVSRPSLSGSELLNIFSDSFACLICMELVENCFLCPKCSQAYCLDCFRTWLSTDSTANACPHCKAAMNSLDLVKCKWMDTAIARTRELSNMPAVEDEPDEEMEEVRRGRGNQTEELCGLLQLRGFIFTYPDNMPRNALEPDTMLAVLTIVGQQAEPQHRVGPICIWWQQNPMTSGQAAPCPGAPSFVNELHRGFVRIGERHYCFYWAPIDQHLHHPISRSRFYDWKSAAKRLMEKYDAQVKLAVLLLVLMLSIGISMWHQQQQLQQQQRWWKSKMKHEWQQQLCLDSGLANFTMALVKDLPGDTDPKTVLLPCLEDQLIGNDTTPRPLLLLAHADNAAGRSSVGRFIDGLASLVTNCSGAGNGRCVELDGPRLAGGNARGASGGGIGVRNAGCLMVRDLHLLPPRIAQHLRAAIKTPEFGPKPLVFVATVSLPENYALTTEAALYRLRSSWEKGAAPGAVSRRRGRIAMSRLVVDLLGDNVLTVGPEKYE